MVNEANLDRIKELLPQATPGPWSVEPCGGCCCLEIHADQKVDDHLRDSSVFSTSLLEAHFIAGSYDGAVKKHEDAELICLMRNVIEGLLKGYEQYKMKVRDDH